MATSVRSSNVNSATTGTAMSVVAPTNTQTGDLVVVTAHGNNQSTIADNNGATPFTENFADYKPNTSSGHVISIFSRRIQASDPGTYNFTLSASGRWSLIAVTFQNPNSGTVYNIAPGTANSNNTDSPPGSGTITCPNITTTNVNALVCNVGFHDNSTGTLLTFPTDFTVQGSVGNEPQYFAYKVFASAGSTGIGTFTITPTVNGVIGAAFAIEDEGVVAVAFNSWRSLAGVGL